MSGETERNESGWTVDTLNAHLQSEIANLQTMLDRRFRAEQEARREIVSLQISVVEQRLVDMDRATQLLHEEVTRFPTDVDKQVGNLRELHGERFASVGQQFSERDERSARESRDNKVAVDAAFAAQKEAAAKQDESNAKAIDKSEKATGETLNKLQGLFETSNKALADKIDDIKVRLGAVESLVNGYGQNKAGGTAAQSQLVTIIFLVVAVVGLGITLITKAR